MSPELETETSTWRAVLWRITDRGTEEVVVPVTVERRGEAPEHRRYFATHGWRGWGGVYEHVGHGSTPELAVWQSIRPDWPGFFATREIVPPGGKTFAERLAGSDF